MNISFKQILYCFIALIFLALLLDIKPQEEINETPIEEELACEVINEKTIYLTINEVFELGEEGYISEDNDIAKVIQDRVFGFSKGETKVSKDCTTYNVIVTNLYTKPIVSVDKKPLECGIFSKKDNELLDNVLAYMIDNAGYKTRAGAVEAARFLLLRFPYHMNYFNENGRTANEGCDGEGRFYIKLGRKPLSLYLNG